MEANVGRIRPGQGVTDVSANYSSRSPAVHLACHCKVAIQDLFIVGSGDPEAERAAGVGSGGSLGVDCFLCYTLKLEAGCCHLSRC